MESRIIFLSLTAFMSIWSLCYATGCNLEYDTTYGSYSCVTKHEKRTCKVFCEDGEFSSPPANEYVCSLPEDKWYPAEVPICGPKNKCDRGFEYTCNEKDALKICPKILNGTEKNINERNKQYCGCHCIGQTFLTSYGKCVPRDRCDCEYNGVVYNIGGIVRTSPINNCICKSTGWDCSHNSATCIAWGDPHYVSFDGMKYDFMGKCSYYLLKTKTFSIEGNNIAWRNGRIIERDLNDDEYNHLLSVTLSVTIRMKKSVITLGREKTMQLIINGYEINVFPFVDESKIIIRKESDHQLTAYLPNGIIVIYNPFATKIIVPPNFDMKHGGLCGVLNKNPNDDFTKPDGSLATTVNEFGNSWKTNSFCPNHPYNDTHPCEGNPIRNAQAKRSCNILKSSIFHKCFSRVPVQDYYESCVYDMCACGYNIEDCLCPAIEVYADKCALFKDQNWRNHVRECQPKCPSGMVWNNCNDPCKLSCSNRRDRKCIKHCVSGCACPKGETLDEYGVCIPEGKCKCRFKEIDYSNGNTIILGNKICTCQNAEWICKFFSNDELRKHCENLGMDLVECMPKKDRTCKNLDEYIETSTNCHKGCVCKIGMVLDPISGRCIDINSCPTCNNGLIYSCRKEDAFKICPAARHFIPVLNAEYGDQWCGCHCPKDTMLNNDGKCVQRNQCNCLIDEQWYKPNEKFFLNSTNDCICENGLWKCAESFTTCTAWGNSHYITFDGKKFDFMGKCSYYLIKANSFSIEGNNVAWQKGKVIEKIKDPDKMKHLPSSIVSVTIRVNTSVIILGKGAISQLIVNGEDITWFPYTDLQSGVTIRKEIYNKLAAYLLNGIKVIYSGYKLDIIIHPNIEKGFKGLCGNYNRNSSDDYTKADGQITNNIDEFGNSWKVDKFCPNHKGYPKNHCFQNITIATKILEKCSILKSSTFAKCRLFVDITAYYEGCLYDTCNCFEDIGNCLCPAIQAYADECELRNISINWRDQVKECTAQCPSGLQYNICNNPCEYSCDEIAVETPCIGTCVAGCGCPKGQTLSRDGKTCIPIAECECKIGDKLLPFNSSRVTSFNNELQICKCQNGKWFCKESTEIDAEKVCQENGNKVLVDCVPDKERTCKNLNETQTQPNECRKGCACDPDFVWNIKNNRCMKKSNCPKCNKNKFLSCYKHHAVKVCPGVPQIIPDPKAQKNEEWCGCHCKGHKFLDKENKCVPRNECQCYYKGEWFNAGKNITLTDDNECSCEEGKWTCTKVVCSGWGDPHYTMFNGKTFDFMGKCSYYLIKTPDFTIEGNNIAWKNGKVFTGKLSESEAKHLPSFTSSITIRKNYQEITIGRDQISQLVVNGIEIKEYPYTNDIAGVTVRKEGESLLEAYLPNDVKVTYSKRKWNILVSKNIEEIFGGLCGILSKDLNDNFMKSDGSITNNVNEFGSSWKTDYTCSDHTNDYNYHPCDRHHHKKALAISKCNILKQDLFLSCHSFVDVHAYYEGCLYDTCACGSSISDCLCSAIQSYADECATFNISINWRDIEEDCKLECPKGLIYDSCYNPYTHSCSAIRHKKSSPHYCIAGCRCPEGQVLDENNKCIPISSCRCVLKNHYYPPEAVEVVEGIDHVGLICECKNGNWDCESATVKTLSRECKKSGRVLSNCIPDIVRTCYNLDEVVSKPDICQTGCVCPTNWVMDEDRRRCIKEDSCSCINCNSSSINP